jgi:fatty-acyl-CoA synthase
MAIDEARSLPILQLDDPQPGTPWKWRPTATGLVTVAAVDDEYEAKLGAAKPLQQNLDDEQALLALNYTSGTTGRPKGCHVLAAGAFLQTLAMIAHAGLDA